LQFNGKYGKILEIEDPSQRYLLQMGDKKQLKVKWENVYV
jgi:hypothetical protein